MEESECTVSGVDPPMRTPASVRLVVLDFDGTLADSAAWFRDVLDEVARTWRFRSPSPEEREALRREDTRTILRALRVPPWKLPFIAAHLRRIARRDAAAIRPFPGAYDLVAGLAARGVSVAVVTSNAGDTVRRVLGPAAAGVKHWRCGLSLFGKAGAIRSVVRAEGCGPDDVLCIGDEIRDIDAARRAGCRIGVVTWGYADPMALAARRPDAVFERMDQILDHLDHRSGEGGAPKTTAGAR